jgi:hypothetical protein
MKKISIVFVATLSLAAFSGCKKKGDCASTIKSSVDRMMAQDKAKEKDMPADMKKKMDEMANEMASKMEAAMTKACVDDKWSADALKCINDAKTEDDFDKCESKLTPEQQASAKKAMAAAMGMGDMDKEAPKPVEGSAEAPAEGSAAPAEGSAAPAEGSAAAADGSAAPAAAGGDLPADCARYRDDIGKLATCEKLPQQSRDAMKKSYDALSKSWANLPAASRDAANTACKSAADSVEKTGKSLCGW